MLHGAFLRLETAETALKRMEERGKKGRAAQAYKNDPCRPVGDKEWSEAVNAKSSSALRRKHWKKQPPICL
ncbi:MAG: hypothetical protein ACLUIQ_03055 [Dialister invisus]